MPINIIPTSTATHLLRNFGRSDFNLIKLQTNKDGELVFPDGESYFNISKKIQGRTVVLHSGSPNPNRGLVELEMILSYLNKEKIKPVEIFFSYFPYGMQDEVFHKGEINFAEALIKKFVDYYRVKKIYAIDAHFWGKKWLNKYPFKNISALPTLLDKVKKEYHGITFVSPDKGSQRRTNLVGTSKIRINSFQTKFRRHKAFYNAIRGRSICVVDDLIETGGTLINFLHKYKKIGAKKRIAIVTHGVLSAGVKKVKKSYTKLYLTNSINIKAANVEISGLIARSLKEKSERH